MDAPSNMPRLAQDMTHEQIEECIAWFVTLPLQGLRQRQAIHDEQIGMALRKGLEAECYSEQIRSDMTTDAVSRQVFGVPMGGLHSAIGTTHV